MLFSALGWYCFVAHLNPEISISESDVVICILTGLEEPHFYYSILNMQESHLFLWVINSIACESFAFQADGLYWSTEKTR